MRRAFILLGLVPVVASAQKLDPVFYVDLRPTFTSTRGGTNEFHWYDRDARPSVVGVRLNLQNGNQIHLSQRLERIENTGDVDSLDEYTLERRGEWKLGKQYLTFGAGGLVRDSAPALSVQTHVVFDRLPATIAIAEAGPGRARGLFARVGRDTGVSVAVGEHLANQPTSLSTIRNPEDAPGRDHGYGLILGIDARQQMGAFSVVGEFASFQQGQDTSDVDTQVSDLRATWRAAKTSRSAEISLLFGWSRDWQSREDFYRISADVQVDRHFIVSPYVRFNRGALAQVGLSSRIRF